MAQAVEWTLGGKTRAFRLDTTALRKLERVAGLPSFTRLVVDEQGEPSAAPMSADLTSAILWCALRDPDVSREQVDAWIDAAGLRSAMLKAAEILGAAMETFAEPVPPEGGPSGTGTPPDAVPSPSV